MTIVKHPNGPRLYVFNQRLHHLVVGLGLIALDVAVKGKAAKAAGIVGTVLVVDDLHDWKIAFKRERIPANV
jgi:hypothetical protein